MADSALIAKFGGKKRPAPKFEDEGEPSEDGRGKGAGATDEESGPSHSEPDMDDTSGGPPDGDGDDMGASADPEQQAVDDLADIVGVGPEDRDDFAAALKSYVSACIASSMMPPDIGADMGGMPGPEEEPPPEDY